VAGYVDHTNSPARVTTSTTTARTATAVPAYSYIRILCSIDSSFRVGDGTVTAATTDIYVVGGLPEVFNTGTGTHVAFILAAGTGTCDVHVLR
jgi:hypothetical protein